MKKLDYILLLLWKFITAVLQILLRLFVITVDIIKNIFSKLGSFRFFAKFAENSFFVYLRNTQISENISTKIAKSAEKFSEKVNERPAFRRRFFIVISILLLLYCYPPSHWGPWYSYQSGTASYYSEGFWFKRTASGSRFIPLFYTAAHRKLPLGITVKVKNLDNGRLVYVKITDRGPYIKGRIIDLSSAAASKLGFKKSGTAKVRIYTRRSL